MASASSLRASACLVVLAAGCIASPEYDDDWYPDDLGPLRARAYAVRQERRARRARGWNIGLGIASTVLGILASAQAAVCDAAGGPNCGATWGVAALWGGNALLNLGAGSYNHTVATEWREARHELARQDAGPDDSEP